MEWGPPPEGRWARLLELVLIVIFAPIYLAAVLMVWRRDRA
jgi:hypothetical protein